MPSVSGGSSINSSSQIANEIILSEDIKDGEIVNADIAAAAAIARSKLDFGTGLVNADIAAAAAIALSKLASDPLARANHTGTQLAATISDFATAVQALLTNPWTVVKKATKESRTNTTVLADDTDLKFTMAANTTYIIRGTIFYQSANATPDIKIKLNGPAVGASVIVGEIHSCPLNNGGTITVTGFQGYAASAISITGTDVGTGRISFEICVWNSTSAGTFAFQWAQNTSDANAMEVLENSFIEYLGTAH